ncbi:MAG: putative acyl-CoA dehydrogenase FadE17 [Rhodocyclaceae bacterium]|nr:putative acyl-CoA dehydrogenase FadE17 [Rhodocyclaceae bacterium]
MSSSEISSQPDWNAYDDDRFRSEVRAFFETAYPEELRYPAFFLSWSKTQHWYRKLYAQGWAAPAWPREWGGMGLDGAKMLIFMEEQERHGIGRTPDQGITLLGPLLIRYASEEQKRQFLPPTLSGEYLWCQGYSEPNAGSDLASLRTEAVIDGDEYVINGSKIWTSYAMDATHMFILVRTDKSAKKQEGISFLLLRMDSPGITVRPIRNLLGSEHFAQVFFDNVRTPVAWRIGKPNQGWTMAKALLGFERVSAGSPKVAQNGLRRLEAVAARLGLMEDAGFRDRYLQLKLDIADLASVYDRFAELVKRGGTPGPDVSMLKILATETYQRLTELTLEAAGNAGALHGKVDIAGAPLDILSPFYMSRPFTIAAGSSEVQRNILAKNVLQLP